MGFPTEKTGWRDDSEWRAVATGDAQHMSQVADALDNLNAMDRAAKERLEALPDTSVEVTGYFHPAHPADPAELDRLITAIDQHYVVEDLGYAGDARIVNVRHKITGEYIMTVTLTQTP